MASSNYHLPTIAAVAGFALAASGYVLSTNSFESKKRRRRIKNKIRRGFYQYKKYFLLLITRKMCRTRWKVYLWIDQHWQFLFCQCCLAGSSYFSYSSPLLFPISPLSLYLL